MGPAPTHPLGEYFGELILKPLPDGRLMQVQNKFGFRDAGQMDWPVPVGTQVDGASIPWPLWSFVGGPYEGKYRDASVVHDYYCDVRIRPWRDVHRTFHDAMIVSGTHPRQAKLMYLAVYYCGPRWTDQAMHNSKLPQPASEAPDDTLYFRKRTAFEDDLLSAFEYDGHSGWDIWRNLSLRLVRGQRLRLNLVTANQLIWLHDPPLSEIESAVDFANLLESSSLTDETRQDHREVFVPDSSIWQALD